MKAQPRHFNFASGGIGSSNHVDMELLLSATGLEMVHVPYNGPAAAIAAVAAGDAHAMIVSVGTGLPLLQSGRIRGLAVFNERRSPQLPDVPVARELGLAHVDLGAWIGLLAPRSTPDAVAARLNTEIAKILRTPAALAWSERQGMEIIGGAPGAFAATLADDHRRWGEVIQRLRLRPD